MDLQFGHGFLSRIGRENYKAVDRCLGPADLFNPDPLTLPWALVDGAWAEDSPDLLGALRRHGTKIIVDTAGWRFRYKATMSIAKLRDASWSPGDALSIVDEAGGRRLVEASLRAQAAVGADAYLVPGWMPETPSEDLRRPYEWILEVAASFGDVPAKPLILWVAATLRELTRSLRCSTPSLISCPGSTSSSHRSSRPRRVRQSLNRSRRSIDTPPPAASRSSAATLAP